VSPRTCQQGRQVLRVHCLQLVPRPDDRATSLGHGLLRVHPVVPVGVLLHFLQCLAVLIRDQAVDLCPQLLRFPWRGSQSPLHAPCPAHGLVDEVVGVGRATRLSLGAASMMMGPRLPQAHSDHGHLGFHEAHHVEDGVPRVRVSPRGVYVDLEWDPWLLPPGGSATGLPARTSGLVVSPDIRPSTTSC